MNPILSQDEMNALLNGVQSGDIDTETGKRKAVSDVRPYDLTCQEHVLQGKMPRLEHVIERFVESFFGGNGKQYNISEEKSFTSIEQRVIKRVVTIALHDLSTAWNEIMPIRPEHVGSEMNLQFVTIVAHSDVIIKIEMQVKVDDFTGKLFLCIPYAMIEPVKDKFCSVIQAEKVDVDQKWIATFKEVIMDSPVELTAELGTAEITFGNLMNLDTGRAINFGKC